MFNFCSLYSGSSGNSLLVNTSTTKILIDVGESAKKVSSALSCMEIDPSQIDAILITHEHSDHVRGLGTFSKKYDIPVYANTKTWDAMPEQSAKINDKNIKNFTIEENFEIGDLKIHPFKIPHEISIATDIGHMTSNIAHKLEDSLFILLEANYDPEILKCSPYPYLLKQRIAGPNGHLPNVDAGKTISFLMNSGLKQVMLGHLSKENNFPELAYKTVVDELIESKVYSDKIKIDVANRNSPSKMIKVV